MDIKRLQEEITGKVALRLIEDMKMPGLLEKAIEERFALLEKMERSNDPLIKLAWLIETSQYDAEMIRQYMMALGMRPTRNVSGYFTAFREVYMARRDEIIDYAKRTAG